MARKQKKQAAGAPEWVMTYGDMMSLLLTFFIMLVALSEIKQEDEWRAVTESVQKAFGMKIGGGAAGQSEQSKQIVQLLEMQSTTSLQDAELMDHQSQTIEEGVDGKESKVTTIRESTVYSNGAIIIFEPGSAELDPYSRRKLEEMVRDVIEGKLNKVEIRGHASPRDLEGQQQYTDLWELSYARARAVMKYLTSERVGLKESQFRIAASSQYEPKAGRQFGNDAQRPNRRVEIVVLDKLQEDFTRTEGH